MYEVGPYDDMNAALGVHPSPPYFLDEQADFESSGNPVRDFLTLVFVGFSPPTWLIQHEIFKGFSSNESNGSSKSIQNATSDSDGPTHGRFPSSHPDSRRRAIGLSMGRSSPAFEHASPSELFTVAGVDI